MQNSTSKPEKLSLAHMEIPFLPTFTSSRRRPSASSLASNDSNSSYSCADNMKSTNSPSSSFRKDSAFEDGSLENLSCSLQDPSLLAAALPKINGYLNVAMGKSSFLLGPNPVRPAIVHSSKKKWCTIDTKGSFLSIYNSFSSQMSNTESPSIRIPLADFKAFPTLLDGGNVVAFVLQSRSADLCLVAFSQNTPQDTINWSRCLCDCDCRFQLRKEI